MNSVGGMYRRTSPPIMACTWSMSALLLGFIFCMYAFGFISTVLTLPEVDKHQHLPYILRHHETSKKIDQKQDLVDKSGDDEKSSYYGGAEAEVDDQHVEETIDDVYYNTTEKKEGEGVDDYEYYEVETRSAEEIRKREDAAIRTMIDLGETFGTDEEDDKNSSEDDKNSSEKDDDDGNYEEMIKVAEELRKNVDITVHQNQDSGEMKANAHDEEDKKKTDENNDREVAMKHNTLKIMEKSDPLPKISTVPKSIWPVTIRNEDGEWEDIIHPGDSSVTMTVPRFWSNPIHDQTLMSRAKAMQVGTCITPDFNGNMQRGDDCDLKDRTIFVAIASYRDWQCRYTVESALSRAKYPERIRIGVVDQLNDGDDHCDVPIKSCDSDPSQSLCKYIDQVDVFQMDALLSIGPVFARHLGHRIYRGEYYAMQSDAHVTYTQDWDVDVIEQQEATGDDMAVLSTYLTDIEGSINEKTGKSLRHTRPIMCNTDYEGGPQGMHLRHLSQPEGYSNVKNQSQLQPYWSAGFSFSRGHFVVNVPYDLYQPMIFQGEEMAIAIRGFTIGYDFFAPERSICFHHYAVGANASARMKVSHFWEHGDRYKGQGKRAMARLLGIVHMNPEVNSDEWSHSEEDRYGIGNVRTPEKFYSLFGVDVVEKKTIPNLCKFVDGGTMHRKFMKYLSSDGMGINYSTITQPFPTYMH